MVLYCVFFLLYFFLIFDLYLLTISLDTKCIFLFHFIDLRRKDEQKYISKYICRNKFYIVQNANYIMMINPFFLFKCFLWRMMQ